MVEIIRKHFPNLKVLTRARSRTDAYELIDHGVENIYRETLYTAVHMGVDALTQLGHRKYSATRQGQRFIKYDGALAGGNHCAPAGSRRGSDGCRPANAAGRQRRRRGQP